MRSAPYPRFEDASRIRTRPGMTARTRSAALGVLRADGVQNVSLALHANAASCDQPLAPGTKWSELNGPVA